MALGQGKGQAKESPAIYLAAFGKHPAWDDHIEDIGIETDFLAQVRRMLYTEGISGNIDSGAWEKLADEQRLAGFAHDFVWWLGPLGKDPARVVVGRLWSSRDGKGRTKYPMAVFAQSTGVPIAVMAREVLASLAGLERKCIEAATASAVRAAIDQAREELRSRYAKPSTSTRPSHDGPSEVLSPSDVARLVNQDVMGAVNGPVREGFARAMYAVEREMGAFLPLGGDSRKSKTVSSKGAEARGSHIRLPAIGPAAPESALIWISLLSRRFAEGTSILALAPRGEPFVDVIVGDPGAAQLYCARASVKGFPLTTDVPYVIDDAFRTKVAEMVARWSGALPAAAAPTASTCAAPVVPPPSMTKRSSLKGWLFGGGAAVVLLGAGAVIMMSRGNGDSPPTPSSQVAMNDQHATSPVPAPTPQAGPQASQPVPSPPPAVTAKENPPAAPSEAAKDAAKDAAKEQERLAQEAKQREEAARLARAEQEAQDRAKQAAIEKARQDEAQKAEAKRLEQEKLDLQAKEAQKAADQARKEDEARQAELTAAAEKATKEAADKAQLVAAVEKDLAIAAAMLRDGMRPQDAAPDGRTLAKLVDDSRSSPAFAAVADGAAAKSVTLQAATIGQIQQSQDTAFLLKQAQSTDDGHLAVAISAAERLAATGWPTDAGDWKSAETILSGIGRGAQGVQDPARASAMAKRRSDMSRSMWLNRWRAIPENDQGALRTAAGSLKTLDISPATLPAGDQFALLVLDLKAKATGITGDVAGGLAAAFVDQAGKIAELPASASEQVAALQSALEQSRAAAAAGPAIDQIGPGSLPDARRWKLESSGDGWVVFSPPQGTKNVGSIEFIRVKTAGGDAYVQSTEVSLGVFDGLVDLGGSWSDVGKLGKLDVKVTLSRVGPSVWEWDIAASQPAGMKPASPQNRSTSRGWFDFDPYMAKTPYFEQGKEPEPPSREHPMQYISPAAAVYAARLAGCRLPTAEEMTNLTALEGQRPANRRDASWMAANEFLARKAGGKNGKWFDGGVFVPQDLQPLRRDKAVAAVESDDRSVLFWSVHSPANDGSTQHAPRNTIGNVAEFVFEGAAAQELLPGDPAGLREAVSKSAAIRIVGASALSPPEVNPSIAYPVKGDLAAGGFSDVGFRLAFDARGARGGGGESAAVLTAINSLHVVR